MSNLAIAGKTTNKAYYIAVDTETGGIGPEVSLLTAYFYVMDQNFKKVADLSLAIKPDNDIYHVTAEALSINKINLIEHQKTAISSSEAGMKLRNFLVELTNQGATKLVPIGHNVAFDLEKIYANVLNKKEAQKYVSYRLLDTGVIAQFMKAAGILPDSVSGSLESLVLYFGVEKQVAHTAEGDVLMTVGVLQKQLEKVNAVS